MTIASSTSQSYETKLVEKLRSGDSAAMEEFYNHYRNKLTWLRSIALHKIHDFYRRQAREPKLGNSSPDFNTLKLEQTGDNELATLTMMESEEIRQSVHQALVGLPQDYQEVLVLKYLKDMPVLAISQIMGRSPKSVEGLLSRARKAMRANLGENNHKS
jgi:RNA polymerase sigma-70 factor (ECF subfamily)